MQGSSRLNRLAMRTRNMCTRTRICGLPNARASSDTCVRGERTWSWRGSLEVEVFLTGGCWLSGEWGIVGNIIRLSTAPFVQPQEG